MITMRDNNIIKKRNLRVRHIRAKRALHAAAKHRTQRPQHNFTTFDKILIRPGLTQVLSLVYQYRFDFTAQLLIARSGIVHTSR